jgi:hypothetical protein
VALKGVWLRPYTRRAVDTFDTQGHLLRAHAFNRIPRNQGVGLVFDGLRNKTVEILGAWLRAQTGKSNRRARA